MNVNLNKRPVIDQTLATTGERALIERIRRRVMASGTPLTDGLRVGIGDDCAVTMPPDPAQWDTLLTSDAVIENVHFMPATDAALVGHKAIGRCLSDVAAMGGEPCWALVNLVAPPSTPLAWADAMMNGLIDTAATCAATVVGGDVATGPTLQVHVFLVGRVAVGHAVRRDGARPGDAIFVTGQLGGSLAGRHLTFQPRLAEGAWLRAGGWASAMIDLSDGLGIDARRLLTASGVAGRIFLDQLPLTAAAANMKDGSTALDHALSDGEDYELLFSVNSAKKDTILKEWADAGLTTTCTRIGEIVEGDAGRLEGVTAEGDILPLEKGYEHFGTSNTANPFGSGNACTGRRMADAMDGDRNRDPGVDGRPG